MKNNKLLLLIISLVVGFGLWLYVITIVSPESEETFTNISVKLEGLQKGLVIVDGGEPTATVVMKGSRTDLSKLSSADLKLKADLSYIVEPGTYDVSYTFVPPGDIPSGAVVVQTRDPGTVTVTVEHLIENRPIDVVIEDNDTNVQTGYTVIEHKLDREQVLVTGPASLVDQIAMARVNVDLTGINKSFSTEQAVTLCDVDGNPVDLNYRVAVEGSPVYLTTVVHQVREVKLEVKIQNGGGATEQTSQITKSVSAISVSGLPEDIKKIDELLENGVLYLGEIDLAAQETDTPDDAPLEFDILKKLPTGVSVVGDTEKMTVTIRFPELDIKELTLKEFTLENVPQGMRGQALAQELKIRIRGPKDVVEQLTAEDVSVVLDFSSSKLGNSKLTAQVVINGAQFKGAGVLGTYQVDVSLEKN